MRIAYVTTYDSTNVHTWSGLGNYVLQTLQTAGMQTECIGNLQEKRLWQWLSTQKRKYYAKLQKHYVEDREPGLLKGYATQVKKRLAPLDYDVIFSPGTIPIAYLNVKKPVVFWTDATFAGLVNFYPHYTNLCAETLKNGHKMEQLALKNCHLAIYSSDWAAQTAIQNYDINPVKVKVVPFGANINCDRTLGDISQIVDRKNFELCKLLFVGVDWQRKGGEQALSVASLLNQRGLRTELHIVGCQPTTHLPNFAKCHGFISKQTAEGRHFLAQLFSEVHFLILPSRADCTPVVIAEASSFGLPALSSQVGGISTTIQDDSNGRVFPLEAPPEDYCNYIEIYMSSIQTYKKLALSSFQEYSNRLNWTSAGKQVCNLLQDFCL
jgi:glycosyltransferase involved in cell wall biosynthesis